MRPLTEVGLQTARQRVSLPSAAGSAGAKSRKPAILEDRQPLASYGLTEGSSVIVKDMGPQISWRTVFILEYLGPLLIHQLFFLYRLNTNSNLHLTQMYASSHQHGLPVPLLC